MPDFNRIIIFTDGACSGNPGPGGWATIIVLPSGAVKELGGGADETTNNRMELIAAIRGLEHIEKEESPVDLYTDSVYVIRGITQWIWGWRKRGWKTAEGADVVNRDLWELLATVVSKRRADRGIKWHYVRGHVGTPGNERVDEIAVAFSKGRRIELYDGKLLQYHVAIHDIPEDTSLPEPSSSSQKPKAKAYSYVSVVNGVAKRHATWPDCEREVKGRSGAKFKKALSAADEQEILVGWGVDPLDIK